MKKNLFKKQGVIDTLMALGLGGAGNAVMDMAVENVDALNSLNPTTINLIKVGVGVAGGALTTNKTIHQVTDGVAVVGASEIVKSIIDGSFSLGSDDTKDDDKKDSVTGLPYGTIGRLRAGNAHFMRKRKVSGLNGVMDM